MLNMSVFEDSCDDLTAQCDLSASVRIPERVQAITTRNKEEALVRTITMVLAPNLAQEELAFYANACVARSPVGDLRALDVPILFIRSDHHRQL